MRFLLIFLLVIFSKVAFSEATFDVKFGYLSVNEETYEYTFLEETNEIIASPGDAWGAVVYPSQSVEFDVKTVQKGDCEYDNNELIDGPFRTWGYYEYFKWSEVKGSCAESISIFIDGSLIKTIDYTVEKLQK